MLKATAFSGGSFTSAMAWNSDGTLLAVGMDFVNASDLKRDIEIIDAETGRTINNIVLGRSGSTSIDWSLDAEQLAVTTSDGIATVWQALRSERLYTAGNYQANMTSWSPDGDWLVAVDDEIDSVLQIWNVPNLQITALIPDIEVESIDWHPDSIFFATANSENQLTIWGVRSGTISRQMTFDSDIYALAWSPDGTRLALGTSGETIIVEP